jgi:hypothetical protein
MSLPVYLLITAGVMPFVLIPLLFLLLHPKGPEKWQVNKLKR